jgi:hypothetical protein
MCLLLTRGADIWQRDDAGWTGKQALSPPFRLIFTTHTTKPRIVALDHAALCGRERALTLLVALIRREANHAARLAAGDIDGRTALHRAARSASLPCVEALLSAGM